VSEASVREAGVLGGRYVLEGLIGRGGMAEVYRAHDRVLGRPVAVKLMRSAVNEADRARFTDEARALARLSHPGLVTMLDAATTDDEPYLVMELINGPSLTECCRGVALQPARVAAIGAQLADALHHAHEAGVVHRDLKPDNVLLTADGRALLTDFGIARLMSDTARHTVTGVTIGTAAYLAPEQVCGGRVTPATDVYALGLVLLEALTGERAYRGLPIEAALARLTTPPTIPDAVPSPWHGLLRSMTALEPAERPSSEEVAAWLRDLASGVDTVAATAALPTGSFERAASLVRASGGRRHGEPAETLPLDLDAEAQWNRLLDHWRRMAGAIVLALLFALMGASVTSDDQGVSASLPANVAAGLEESPRVETARDGEGGDQAAPQDEERLERPGGDVDEPRGELDAKRKDREKEGGGGRPPKTARQRLRGDRAQPTDHLAVGGGRGHMRDGGSSSSA
jgi:tRNA A-37 threonylcarbamoyl transferase component Bud32